MKTIAITIFAFILSAAGFQSAYAQSVLTQKPKVQSTAVNQENKDAAETARVAAAKQADAQRMQAAQKEKEAYMLKLEQNKPKTTGSAASNKSGSSVSKATAPADKKAAAPILQTPAPAVK